MMISKYFLTDSALEIAVRSLKKKSYEILAYHILLFTCNSKNYLPWIFR
jgi:hypothetical protein